MHIRPITTADIPSCITIVDAAFEGNELSDFLNPNRTKYPLSWRQHCLISYRNNYYKTNKWGFVCVADADDEIADDGEILGYARWSRHVSKEDAATDPWNRRLSLFEWVESWLCWAEQKWEKTLRINPAIGWTNNDAFIRATITSSGFSPVSEATHWHLDSLSVAPQYQRRGVAQKLVEWGIESAKMESESEERRAIGKPPVPITLVGTAQGLHLYRRMGFKVVDWEDDSFLGFPAEGGSTIVWDPTGYWIQDIDYEEPIKRGVVEAIYTTRDAGKHSDTLEVGSVDI